LIFLTMIGCSLFGSFAMVQPSVFLFSAAHMVFELNKAGSLG